jgi:hypothetical protein
MSVLHRYTSASRLLLLPAIGFAVLFAATGCSSTKGPESLVIPASAYGEAFDAAVEAARSHGMAARLRDRRHGIIETDFCYAGSLLEPWRTDNADFHQTMENTLNFQRRRSRFEFVPVGSAPTVVTGHSGQLTGPDVVVGDVQQPDLTVVGGELELRVWVYVERGYTRGVKRNTWSQSANTTFTIVSPEGQPPVPTGTTWTPVSRDRAYEQRLMAAVQSELAISEPDESSTGDAGNPTEMLPGS